MTTTGAGGVSGGWGRAETGERGYKEFVILLAVAFHRDNTFFTFYIVLCTNTVPEPDTFASKLLKRWGTVQYGFTGEASDEVSVSAGERVKVLTDMGDWLHILTLSGARCVRGGSWG